MSNVSLNESEILFYFIKFIIFPVILVSSHAIISAFIKASYYLIDKSFKFPIGVGIIVSVPLFSSYF